ncbi:MAG: hypothetical protein H8E21_08565 [Gammaproteobacteria bacterium]|nr:hypothetical protein [Gammaproteobacteria bacterium]
MDKPSDLSLVPKAAAFSVNIFLIVIFIAVIVIGVVAYSFQLGYKMNAGIAPQVDATMKIKLETTTAHLWFEEIISGDRVEKIENVIKHIDNAIWYAQAMLEGGKNPEGVYVPMVNPLMRQDIREVLAKIRVFKTIIIERYEAMQTSGVGTPIDQRVDGVFNNFQEQANVVEAKLQEAIAADLKQYRFLQFFLLVSLIVITVLVLYIFFRYEKKREENLASIQEAQNRVKILSGFLPVCSSCKKIKDDEGDWHQIESYIKEHSEAVISHSICPECSNNIYHKFVQKSASR